MRIHAGTAKAALIVSASIVLDERDALGGVVKRKEIK
jgi:hypothetical protein